MAFVLINCVPSSTILKIGGNSHRFYYTISGENNGLDFNKLRNILSEYNFYPKAITEPVHISFGTFYGGRDNYDPLFIKQHAAIKNVLNGHNVICDKTLFHKTV